MGAERCKKKREKSVKARGGIEWGSATAANRARKLRIESGLKSKARRANLRTRKSTRAKSSARGFTDRASRKGRDARREFSDLARRTRIKRRRKQRGAQRNFALLEIL